MNQKALPALLLTLGLFTAPAFAADSAKPAVPNLGDILDASGITMSGYLDMAYNHLSTAAGSTTFRAFDTEANSFNLHQLGLIIAKQPKEGFGGLVNVTAGEDASVTKSYGWNTSEFDLTQAYVSYTGGPLTVIGGKFATLAGAELITSPSNPNYSHSLLFTYGPYTHTGLRATYAVSDMVSLIAGVNNGWDQVRDMNRNKTVELGVTASPNKMLSLAASAYSGVEQLSGAPGGVQGKRDFLDLLATINATDKLTFVVNYDTASQENATLVSGSTGKAKWNAIVGYANYQISDQWRVSFRAERFDDKDGYKLGTAAGATSGQKVKDYTLTVAYMPTKSAELRAEVRQDKSDQLMFTQTDGSMSKDQSSFGLQAIYKF